MTQILAGLITYLLLAIYYHKQHAINNMENRSVSIGLDSRRKTKFSMNPGLLNSNYLNIINNLTTQRKIYMQVFNQTLLTHIF